MRRKLTFALAFAAAVGVGTIAAADETRGQSPIRSAVYTQSDEAQIVEVDGRRRYRGNYYNNRRYNNYRYNYYTPYRYGYRYNYAPYGYGYTYPRYGYYNNYGGGGVQFGRFGVWW